MAKKTTPGRGQKQCPNCDAIVAARATLCKNCGHKFRKKRKKRSAKSKPAVTAQSKSSVLSNEQIATVLGAQELIQKCGGLNEAITLIKTVADAES
jgi:DNA-directed RNA polymerase subunit M/transcription elongation factor TFIIS